MRATPKKYIPVKLIYFVTYLLQNVSYNSRLPHLQYFTLIGFCPLAARNAFIAFIHHNIRNMASKRQHFRSYKIRIKVYSTLAIFLIEVYTRLSSVEFIANLSLIPRVFDTIVGITAVHSHTALFHIKSEM